MAAPCRFIGRRGGPRAGIVRLLAVALPLSALVPTMAAVSSPGSRAYWVDGVAYVQATWHGHDLQVPLRGLARGTDLSKLRVQLSDPPANDRTTTAGAFDVMAPATTSAAAAAAAQRAPSALQGSSIYPANSSTAPGTVVSVAGGHCDGYRALDATVSPNRLAVDGSGQLWWVDDDMAQRSPGWTTQGGWGTMTNTGSNTVRHLGADGRVQTLGPLISPEQGRSGRQTESTDTLTDVIPDGRGGVIANITGYSADLYRYQVRYGGDAPASSSIVGISRDGHRRVLVQGGPPPNFVDWVPAAVYGTSYPLTGAPLGIVEAFTRDPQGNLFIASQALMEGSPNDAASPYEFGLPVDGYPTDVLAAPPPTVASVIEYANLGNTPKTFYAGTAYQTVVPPRSLRAIAGWGSAYKQTDDLARTVGANVNPVTAFIPEVPKLELHGSTLYVQSDFVGTADVIVPGTQPKHDDNLEIQAINLGSTDTTVNGVPVAASTMSRIVGDGVSMPGFAGDGGLARAAAFRVTGAGKIGANPSAMPGDFTVKSDGTIFISDSGNNRIRAVSPQGFVSTVAGNGIAGDAGTSTLPAVGLPLNSPFGLVLDRKSRLLFVDYFNKVVRRLNSDGTLTTVLGRGPSPCGLGEYATGTTWDAGAYLGQVANSATDARGNTYIYDAAFRQIRRINTAGRIDLVIGRGVRCASWFHGPGFLTSDPATHCPINGLQSGDGGPFAAAGFGAVNGMTVDGFGNLYITDLDRVRYVNIGRKNVTVNGVEVPAGNIATLAVFPARRVHVDEHSDGGSLPPLPVQPPDLPEPLNHILKGVEGTTWEPLHASFTLNLPLGDVTVDGRGNLFIADPSFNYVYRLDSCGRLSTIAGSGAQQGPGGEGEAGPPTKAPVTPVGLTWDPQTGVLLVATHGELLVPGGSRNDTVRGINLSSQTVREFGRTIKPQTIGTIAGMGTNFYSANNGDGGKAYNATLSPTTLAIGPGRRLYLAGWEALGEIRVITPDGRIFGVGGPWSASVRLYRDNSVVQGGTVGDGGPALDAWFHLASSDGQGTGSLGEWVARGNSGDFYNRVPTVVRMGPRGTLLVPDAGGRVRAIIDPLHAPLRSASVLTVGRPGAGAGFTGTLPLYDDGLAVSTPTGGTVVNNRDGTYGPQLLTGNPSLASGVVSAARGAGRGCMVWKLAVGHDGRLSATSLGNPNPGASGSGLGGSSCAVTSAGDTIASATPVAAGDTSDSGFAGVAVSTGHAQGGWQSAFVPTVPPESVNRGPVALGSTAQQFVLAHSQGGSVAVTTSTDGLVYNPVTSTTIPVNADLLGDLVPGPQHTLLLGLVANNAGARTVDVARRGSGGRWQVAVVATLPPVFGAFAPVSPPSLATDAGGTSYLVWSDDRHVSLSRSRDGLHWSPPQQLAIPGLAVLPGVVAGAAGKAAVAFYQNETNSSEAMTAGYPYALWYSAVASVDGRGPLGPVRLGAVRLASRTAVHYGAMCLSLCNTATLSDQITGATPKPPTSAMSPLPYGPGPLRPQLDANGRVMLAFTLDPRSEGSVSSASVVAVVRDCRGSRLRAGGSSPCLAESSGGSLAPAPIGSDAVPPVALPPLVCLNPATPYPPVQQPAAPQPRPATHQPGHPAPRPPTQPVAVVPPIVPEPPLQPALPPGQAPAPAQQLSQAQQMQQAAQPQTGLQVGVAAADEAQAERARSFAYSRRSTSPLPSAALAWGMVGGLGVVLVAVRRRRRPAYVVEPPSTHRRL